MDRTLSDSCKILFLFGAGASIPAGVKSTAQFTEWLRTAFRQDPFLKKHDWLPSLWAVIERHAKPSEFAMGPYEPNFEHLIYTVELLEDYMDVARVPNKEYFGAIKELGKRAQIRNDFEAYAAASYALLPITLDAKSTNPWSRRFKVKGSSAKFMWVGRALRRLLADQFPDQYTIDHLEPFIDVFREAPEQIAVATTNYDLVFDHFLTAHGIPYDDGFTVGEEPSSWRGFSSPESGLKYLKLHGSLNWFEIKKNWFNVSPSDLSPNDVYKVKGSTVKELLSRDLVEKASTNMKFRFEFDVPHLILGGNKDRKLLDVPYVDIHREWTSRLTVAETIVFVGVGGFDFHLLQQVRGLIATNRFLDKVLIVNPSVESHRRLSAFLDLWRNRAADKLFHVECNWDPALIEAEYKLPFSKMLRMSATDLYAHYREHLSG